MADKKDLPLNAMTGDEYVKKQVAEKMGDEPKKEAPEQEKTTTDEPKDDDSKYAKKKTLFEVMGGKMVLFGLGCVGLVILIGGSLLFYTFINNINSSDTPMPLVTPSGTEPELVDIEPEKAGVFGYIKDKRSIWTIDINGKNREQLLEISAFRQRDTYTELSWKTEKELSYATCPLSTGNGCRVFTHNVDDKSQIQELFIADAVNIPAMQWNSDQKYLAMVVEDKNNYNFYFRSGTVLTKLNTFLKVPDSTRTKTRALFSENGEYVIFYAEKRVPPERKTRNAVDKIVPVIEVYRINGVKVDSMENASDPFAIDDSTLGFQRDNILYYKTLSEKDETRITTEGGINPVISPDKSLIAYWNNETSDQKKVVLQVFDTNLNIRRDILRGIILPIWLTDNRIAGIKSDNCLGDECLLFEFQTAGLVVVDIKTTQIFIIDQGALISNVKYNPFIKNVVESTPQSNAPSETLDESATFEEVPVETSEELESVE